MVKKLNNNLINKIKAGEVIERIQNVVKELVENAVDASSTIIRVELIESGIKKIVVKDNGVGMSKQDALMSIVRHATSKIENDSDIENITTLGFRGEAIPSIHSVSKFTLKTSDSNEGTTLYIEGGELKKESVSDLEQGTTITVENLFYNMPVRYKFLRSLPYELSLVTKYLSLMAIFHPEIAFTLVNDQNEIIKTSGSGDMKKAIFEVYKREVTENLFQIEEKRENFKIEGYIGKPSLQKRTKNFVNVFINNRVVRVYELEKTVIDIYHEYMPDIKYPYTFINISIDERLVDVNVHPQKREVRLSNMKEIKLALSALIYKTLKENSLEPVYRESKIIEDLSFKEDIELKKSLDQIGLDFSEMMTVKTSSNQFRYLGTVFETFFIVESLTEKYFLLVDYHAAAERINYELVLKELDRKKVQVTELTPISIELEKSEIDLFNRKNDLLKSIGFNLEHFGENTYLLRSYPYFFKGITIKDIKDILELLADDKFNEKKYFKNQVATIACRMSIKANDYISESDVYYLLDELFKCDNPYNCPHGRPTFIKYSKYEIEKAFKRIMN